MAAGEAVAGENAAFASKLGGIEHLVGAGIEEHRLGVHPRLVVERGRGGHRGVEGDGDAEDLRKHRVELGQHLEPVVLDQLGLDGHQPGHHRRERDDAIALPDTEDGGVDVRRPGLECRERVGHRAAGVVVSMELDVTADVAPHQRNQIVDLRRRSDPDGVGEADPIHARAVDRAIDAHQVVGVTSKRVLGAEARFAAGAADLADHGGPDVDDLVDAHAVRDGTEPRRRCDEHVDAVNTGIDGEPRVVEAAPNVGEQAKTPLGPRQAAKIRLRLR